MDIEVELTKKEFLEKKLDVAKEVLTMPISLHPPEYIIDKKKRGSIIYNSVSVSLSLMKEIGFTMQDHDLSLVDQEVTAIRKLEDLLNED